MARRKPPPDRPLTEPKRRNPTYKWCPRCGGRHPRTPRRERERRLFGRAFAFNPDDCGLVLTAHGTRCRPDLRESLEARQRDRTQR